MKKSTKLKKILALFLVVLMSIENFASIITDSSGGAFVTKQEFEDLKSTFAGQIDNYNNSIDEKIDGAIALYLAGIDIHSLKWVDSNIDVLDYPLTIIDKLKVIDECTTSSTNLAEQVPIWCPGFTLFTVLWRSGTLVTEKFEKKQIDNVKYYLNGTANTSAGTFKVTNICQEPKMTWTDTFIHENCSAADGWDGGAGATENFCNTLYLDADSLGGSADGKWWTRTTRDNYAKLWSTDLTDTNKYALHFTTWHHAYFGGSIYNRTDNIQARYDKYYSDGYNTKWETGNGFLTNYYPDNNLLYDYTYSNKKLDRIYNYGSAANNSHFAPVAYNNHLKFTNKKANRRSYSHDKIISWHTRSTDTLYHKYVKWLITAGENLEHEVEDTSRSWNNKSLISANRIVYDFETPDGELKTNHRMVQGIPILHVSKDFRAPVIQKIQVRFDLTNSYVGANPKYILFSKKPITTQNYSDNVEANTDYVKIDKINGTTIDARKGRLDSGSNLIELDEKYSFDVNDVIYMKILWNDNYTINAKGDYDESVIITKPQVAYVPESD